MQKYKKIGLICLFTGLLSACAVNPSQQEQPFPQEQEAAAQFLAIQTSEHWVFMKEEESNLFYINPLRKSTNPSSGTSQIWMKMTYPTPVSLENNRADTVDYALMTVEVHCADQTARTSAYYAVSEQKGLLEKSVDDYAPFLPLGSDATAQTIYYLACEL